MIDIKGINTKEEMLSDNTLDQLFEIKNEIERERYFFSCLEKAKILGCKTEFDKLYKVQERLLKKQEKAEIEEQKAEKRKLSQMERITDFNYFGDGTELNCGNWQADFSGVRTFSMFGEILACYHPILPIRRLANAETGEEQIVLAFYRKGQWKEVKVKRGIISSATKIVELANKGIAVTSENARYLVKYLSDIENLNEDIIDIQTSTSKLGWNGSDFIPYDHQITFDGDERFKSLFDSITTKGDSDKWYEYVKKLRGTDKKEIKFMIATSLASILVGKFKALPFILDLWGFTEGGKSVSLMLACSVWANPDESQYIGDLKTTDVALETKADLLNNLPMMMDDTSQTSARVRDNFEGIVYQLCSGKGKSRSNKDLGINRENHWRNCFITNGERPLSSYVSQGGAINRILEVECSEKIYENPQETAQFLKENYGFCGRDFVDVIKNMPIEELEKIRDKYQEALIDERFTQKQTISLSIILTADEIAEEYLFKDGNTLTMSEAKSCLTDINEVSDYVRCYEFLLDKVQMNRNRFATDVENVEKWGMTEGDKCYFFTQAFKDLCAQGGFNAKSFLAWATKTGKVDMGNDKNPSKVKKIDGRSVRCVCLKLSDNSTDENFVPEEIEDDLPFA